MSEDAKKKQASLDLDLKWLLNHEPGRRICWWLLDQAGLDGSGIFEDGFTSNSMTLSYIMGQRAHKVAILSALMAADKGALARIMEQHNRSRENDGTRN